MTKLSAEDREILEHPSWFHEVHSTSDLPSAVVTLCAGEKGNMANPGEKWNATDVVIDTTLPAKRLIWAATNDHYYVVHYERGGIAHSYHILVAKLPKGAAKPQVIWSAMGGPFKDYPGFLAALRSGKLDDRLDYAR